MEEKINPSFNLFQVNVGATSNAKVEQAALEKVGCYGKQIGRLAEALEVVIHHSIFSTTRTFRVKTRVPCKYSLATLQRFVRSSQAVQS